VGTTSVDELGAGMLQTVASRAPGTGAATWIPVPGRGGRPYVPPLTGARLRRPKYSRAKTAVAWYVLRRRDYDAGATETADGAYYGHLHHSAIRARRVH
jgi:hypothetical protein